MDVLKKIEASIKRLEALMTGQKEILTLDEMANYAGLSKSYVYKLTSTNRIPFYKPNGKNIYFKRSEVDNWLLQNRSKTDNEIETEAANHSFNKKR